MRGIRPKLCIQNSAYITLEIVHAESHRDFGLNSACKILQSFRPMGISTKTPQVIIRPKSLQNPQGRTYCRIARRLCEEAAKLQPKRCQMVTKHKVASPVNLKGMDGRKQMKRIRRNRIVRIGMHRMRINELARRTKVNGRMLWDHTDETYQLINR